MQTVGVIEYNASLDPNTSLAYGIRTGQINLTQPLNLNPNSKKAYRILRVMMSPMIANIYQYNGFDNTKLRITNDGGVTWVNVQLKNGNYTTLKVIQDAINDIANQLNWYTSSSDPAITIDSNAATGLVYTKLDSTKLALGTQIGVDYSYSSLYVLFGYTQIASTFITDAVHTATLEPRVDTQGTFCRVYCSFIQNTRWKDGVMDASICKIPFVTGGNEIEIIYPGMNTGTVSPIIPATIPSFIQSITFRFVNQYGKDVVFLYGNCSCEIEIMDY